MPDSVRNNSRAERLAEISPAPICSIRSSRLRRSAATPQWTGFPTKIAIDTTSGYLIDTANYNDLVILNGGIRYDDYDIKASGFGTVNGAANVFGAQAQQHGLPNFNLGLTLKPLPNGSVYVAYATSSNPVGAEFDGTSAQYGGLAPSLNGNPNQIFGPEKNKAIEIGTKWELFDRRLLVTAALFQTEKENARESQNFTAMPRCCERGGAGLHLQHNSRYQSACQPVLHHRRCGLSHPGHRSRRRRQDHRQMERVRRAGADEVRGDEVSGSVGRSR